MGVLVSFILMITGLYVAVHSDGRPGIIWTGLLIASFGAGLLQAL